MSRPLDHDLRRRIVAAVEAGASCRSAAARFDVSWSAAIKLMRRYRATGSLAPGKMGGHRRPILEAQQKVCQPQSKSDKILGTAGRPRCEGTLLTKGPNGHRGKYQGEQRLPHSRNQACSHKYNHD